MKVTQRRHSSTVDVANPQPCSADLKFETSAARHSAAVAAQKGESAFASGVAGPGIAAFDFKSIAHSFNLNILWFSIASVHGGQCSTLSRPGITFISLGVAHSSWTSARPG